SDVASFAAIIVVGELVRAVGATIVRGLFGPVFSATPLARYLDQLAGVFAGALRGLLYVAIAFVVVGAGGFAPDLKGEVERSPIAGLVIPAATGAVASVTGVVDLVVGVVPPAPQPY